MAREARHSEKNMACTTTLTFQSAVELFVTQRRIRGLTKQSLQFYDDVFHFVEAHGFPQNISTCTTHDIEGFILKLLDSGMRPVTINGKLRGLKALFNFLHERKIITDNPIKPVQFLKHEKPVIKTFHPNHIRALLTQCADGTFAGVRDAAVILTFLDTGIRLSELLSLHVTELDLENRSAVVMGKSRRGRTVYYSERTRDALSLYLLERGELDHTLVWVAEDNSPLQTRSLQDRLHDLGQRAGVTDVRCSPHTFRHTAAKMCIQNGMDIFSLQKMLGHSSLEMVRNYVEMFDDDIAEAHAKFSPVQSLH